MSKKRKCRMDREEILIHDEAVRLRKMTDRQLVGAFRMAAEDKAKADEARKPKEERKESDGQLSGLEIVIQGIADGKIKGVGKVTSYKIAEFAREQGILG